jgi:hypothetical protein
MRNVIGYKSIVIKKNTMPRELWSELAPRINISWPKRRDVCGNGGERARRPRLSVSVRPQALPCGARTSLSAFHPVSTLELPQPLQGLVPSIEDLANAIRDESSGALPACGTALVCPSPGERRTSGLSVILGASLFAPCVRSPQITLPSSARMQRRSCKSDFKGVDSGAS